MSSAIVVHPKFDGNWPFAADHCRKLWQAQVGEALQFVRLADGPAPAVESVLKNPHSITRLALFDVGFNAQSLAAMPALKEIAARFGKEDPLVETMKTRGIRVLWLRNEGMWGQSVSEFGFALTLCGLRRIPQTHHSIQSDLSEWKYAPTVGEGRPGMRGHQYGDDSRFTNGTLEGKRVRIVGAGNIASRYASFCHFFGAEVAAWDPFAGDPAFHRAGSRREQFLERLVQDAEIFAPMVPLMDSTRGLIKKEHIEALPKGCLVVMITRAAICDCETLYRRVLNDELALVADVFMEEPLPLGHALLGRPNVVHTPHNAGRTKEANFRLAQELVDQFLPQ